MNQIIGPKGWNASKIEHRFSTSAPLSYDASDHSCEAVLSTGATVNRIFGTETLEISKKAIHLSRAPFPLLDSHNQGSVIDAVLGKIDHAWISGGELLGRIIFAQTPRGKLAEGMVARGEVAGISCGYTISKWEIRDSDGDLIDADKDRVSWSDELSYTAVRWMLYECSLTGVPADIGSQVRSIGGADAIDDTRARMHARQHMSGIDTVEDVRSRMLSRQRMYERQNAIDGTVH